MQAFGKFSLMLTGQRLRRGQEAERSGTPKSTSGLRRGTSASNNGGSGESPRPATTVAPSRAFCQQQRWLQREPSASNNAGSGDGLPPATTVAPGLRQATTVAPARAFGQEQQPHRNAHRTFGKQQRQLRRRTCRTSMRTYRCHAQAQDKPRGIGATKLHELRQHGLWPATKAATSARAFFSFLYLKNIKISKIYVHFEIFQKYPRSPLIGRQALSVNFFFQICNEVPRKKRPCRPPTGDRGLSPIGGRQALFFSRELF